MAQHEGKDVEVLRDAKEGDPGFEAGKDQVVVRLPDGSEKTVMRSEITPAN